MSYTAMTTQTTGTLITAAIWNTQLTDNITYLYNAQNTWNGWLPAADTWTRTGNHTFTIAGDFTSVFKKGTRVRYKDGGAYEYGVVSSSSYGAPNTTVNLFVNTDFVMAAATITDTYYSYGDPPDFPHTFTFASVPYGTGGTIGAYAEDRVYSEFYVRGNICHLITTRRITNKGSWTTNVYQLLPIAPAAAMGASYLGPGFAMVVANAGLASKAIGVHNNSSGAVLVWWKAIDTAVLQWADVAVNDYFTMNFDYEY